MAKGVLRRVFLLAVAALVAVGLAACGGGGGGGGGGQGGGEDVTVASDIAYPPFEFEKNGEPTGFDIDLMDEIGRRAGFTPEYQNVTFDGIIGGLANNQYDAVISAMTITDERAQRVDFSDPYFNADQSLLVPSDSGIGSVEQLWKAALPHAREPGCEERLILAETGLKATSISVTTTATISSLFLSIVFPPVDAS